MSFNCWFLFSVLLVPSYASFKQQWSGEGRSLLIIYLLRNLDHVLYTNLVELNWNVSLKAYKNHLKGNIIP